MERFEKYIRNNREAFDSYEPPAGHFQRFERRMKTNASYGLRRYFLPALRVAAILILALLSGLWIKDNVFIPEPAVKGITLSQVSPELREVEVYYASLIEEKYSQIKSIDLNSEETQKEILLRELEEMNTVYQTLQVDLKNDPNNDRIINAMIQYYQTKADVMAQIIEKLKEFESITPKSQENESIGI